MRGVSQLEEILLLLTALFLLPALPVARALGGSGAPHGDLGLTYVHAPEGYEARRGLIRAEPETLARQRAAQPDASNQEGELRNNPAVNLLSLSSKVKKAEAQLLNSAALVQGAWKAPPESQDPTQQPRGAWRPRGWMSDVALSGEVGAPDRSAKALIIGTSSTVVILLCMFAVCMFGGDSKHDGHEGPPSLPASPAQSTPATPVAQAEPGQSFEPSAPSPPRSFTSAEERRRLVRLEEVFGPGGNPFGACPTQHAEARRSVHTMHIPDLERVLGCSLKDARLGPLGVNDLMGLTDELVQKKDKIFGRNKMTPPVRPNIWWLLIKQVFGGVFNVLLWLCVVAELLLAMYMGGDDLVTPVILSGVIVLSGVLQWWTEQRAESMMNALQSMQGAESVSTFRRGANGVTRLDMLSSEELMPGDVIMLEAGHRVPADVRIVDCTDGALAESSAITGESIAEKRNRSTIVAEVPPPIVEANNIMWCGTSVVQGRLICVVFGTGDDTLLGQIASKIRSSRTRSSLEIQIEHFVHLIAIVATCVSALSLLANLLSPAKASMATMLTNAATAFFTQVPEGLMPTVTLCLMIASQQMATRQVLVRRIDAVETLGCVGVLCSDKTGTLTSGHMTATDFVIAGPSGTIRVLSTQEVPNPLPVEASRLAQCGLLNSTAKDSGGGQLSGSPTEVAIVTACQKMLNVQVDRARSAEPLIFEIPFNSANKWMLTAHAVEPRKGTPAEQAEPVRLILKGAPERVITHCKMPPGLDKEIEQTLEHLMGQGKRLLCVAERRITIAKDFKFAGSCLEDTNFPMDDYEFCGLFALEDPPKEGVPESIARMKKAGCVTVMVTGDHPSTAKAIAKRIGILGGNDGETSGSDDQGIREQHLVITGAMIESRTPLGGDAELHDLAASPQSAPDLALFWQRCVRHTRVFARVSPMHKRTIVQAYQHFGEQIVAMTGDGVNDAPALKEAEVGIAMGIRGTEVAKEAADIVLLDDNLRSVVAGMEQGRLCSENLRKSILYTLCSKVPQALPTFAQLFGVPSALTAAQVLLIDIGTDIWTAIAYACQPGEMALMETPPRHPKKDKMVNGRMLLFSFGYIGVIQSMMCWVFFFSMPKMWSLTKQAKASGAFTDLEREANYTAMTMYYWTLVMGQVGAAFATTTTQQSLFKYGLPNFWLNLCIVLEIALALAVIYWPMLQGPFGTRALTPGQLALGTVAFFLIVAVEEVRKFLTRQPPQASASERRRSLEVVLGPSGVLDPGTAAHARQSLVT